MERSCAAPIQLIWFIAWTWGIRTLVEVTKKVGKKTGTQWHGSKYFRSEDWNLRTDIFIYFFLFPLVKHLWESLVIKTLCDLCVYIRDWLLYISNLGFRGTFASHFKPLPLVAFFFFFFFSVFFDTTGRVLPILSVVVFLIKNINAFSATSQAARKPRTLFLHHQHSVGILWTIILFHASRPDIAFKRSSLLFSYLT